jgi:hypothetical protein
MSSQTLLDKMLGESNSELIKKDIRKRKEDKAQAVGVIGPMPFAPPATVAQIAANRNYYNQVEYLILRSINGSQYK